MHLTLVLAGSIQSTLPVRMVSVLEGEGAIARNRELMGATDPKILQLSIM